MAHQIRGWVDYTPQDTARYGSVVSIKCDTQTATNNGATVTTAPSTYDFWPAHRSDMRAVYGVTTDRYRDLCIALTGTGGLYTLGATFGDDESNTYTVNALRAEKFRIRNIK